MTDDRRRTASLEVQHRPAHVFDAGFVISALIALVLWYFMADLELRDFSLFWKAAVNLKRGVNPYAFTGADSVSLNTPVGLGLLSFFAFLPYDSAKELYVFTMYFAFLWSIWVGYRLFYVPLSHHPSCVTLIVLAIPFGAFFQVAAWGSLIVFAVIGISAFYCLDPEEHAFAAGCCLGLCTIKPHLFLLCLAWTLGQCLSRRRMLLPLGLSFISLLASLTALFFQPRIFQMYADVYTGGLPHFAIINASIGNILYSSVQQHRSIFLLWIPFLAALSVLPFIGRCNLFKNLRVSFILLLPFSLLVSGYCWGHDYLSCFATSFVAVSLLADSLERRKSQFSIMLALGLSVSFILGTLVSPGRPTWFFVFYGLSLSALSALIIYGHRRFESSALNSLMDTHPTIRNTHP